MIENFKTFWHGLPSVAQLSDILPFVCLVEGKPKLNTSRITEMLIGAAIIGLVAGYISAREIKVEVENLKAQVSRVEARIDKLYESKR